MIETAIVWSLLSRDRRENYKSNTKNDTVILVLRILIAFSYAVFYSATSMAAYRCNGNSMAWGLFGFFLPFMYIIGHTLHGFQCDSVAPNGQQGLRDPA